VQTNSGVMLSWGNLQAQFGSEYKDPKKFKTRVLGALRGLARYRGEREARPMLTISCLTLGAGLVWLVARSALRSMVREIRLEERSEGRLMAECWVGYSATNT
jgi:hypothetical protein